MNESPPAVFLSYASQDAGAARRICEALRGAGLEVWFDQSELRGGDAWDASIRKQIKECALFVPLISDATNARSEGYFRLEWKLAVDRSHLMSDDRTFLLPVLIDDIADADARVPDRFRERQWSRLMAGDSPAALAERVRRLLPGSAASVPRVTPPRAVAPAAPVVATALKESPSIAVLAFVNRSRDEEDEYFSDGLADELLTVLAKIRGLRVAARTSSFQFKGKNDDLATIGSKLNVATLLEGSVRKSGNRVRISVQLVKVADGYQLWSETYDRTLDDIFAVQDDIAQSVVKELRAMLFGDEAGSGNAVAVMTEVAAAAKGRGTDPEAHRLYLQGRYLVERMSREDVARGIVQLRRAVELDAGHALAWACLAGALTHEANLGESQHFAPGIARAREAARRAMALEPDLAEGHLALGLIQLWHDFDWNGAEASFRRAMELAPGSADVLRAAGLIAHDLGRSDDAMALSRRAIEQDPLSVQSYSCYGRACRGARKLAEAEAAYRKALELSPQGDAIHCGLALVLDEQGRGEEALAVALAEKAAWARLLALAVVHHTGGRPAESDEALRTLTAADADGAAVQIAQIHALRGDANAAFAWMERAYTQHDLGLAQMKLDPLFRALHADPRWQAFLTKMRLAD